jgi:nucleoside 2-deoxyribosyltransferase
MKLYLAAMFSRQEEMQEIGEHLKSKGFEIMSRWVYGGEATAGSPENCAILDLEDVDAADAIVCFTHQKGRITSGGGRHVEFGYALANGKRCFVIGPEENIFYHLAEQYDSIEEFIEANKP